MEEVEEEEEQVEEEENEPVIEEAPSVPLPAVRKTQDVKMDFTEKKFAHLPARESQHREAPYPKSKKIDKTKDELGVGIDIEDKDPLWLKDKGDHFFKRHDYHSAMHAYSKSIQNDKSFLMSRLNRGTTFIMTRAFEACVDEMNDILDIIKQLPQQERDEDDEFYTKMTARAYLKRGAANAWLS